MRPPADVMILFASDIHLSPSTPEISQRFLAFLAGPVARANALYLLGDLFEYWAGDEELDEPFAASIVAALRRCATGHTTLAFLPGNRDFLVGERFYAASGMTPLDDPHILSVPAWQFVLTHGDQLCTDDVDYQAFRRQVRTPTWRAAFLARPLAERKALIADLRARSEAAKQRQARHQPDVMDVAPGSTDDFLRHCGYATLIHGHTHRPSHHDHMVDGIHCERWVLGDWHASHGDYLAWDGTRITRHAC